MELTWSGNVSGYGYKLVLHQNGEDFDVNEIRGFVIENFSFRTKGLAESNYTVRKRRD